MGLVGETLAKLYAAVVFAFIAALVIIITGLSSDARGVTVFFRSVVGFISSGLCVYIVLRILAAKDIVDFDDLLKIPDVAEVEEEGMEADAEEAPETEGSPGQETGEADKEEEGTEAQFEPLSSDNLTRMESPEQM